MGTAVAPGRSPTEVTCGVAGTAGYSEHLDYTIHSFVIKCILTKTVLVLLSIDSLLVDPMYLILYRCKEGVCHVSPLRGVSLNLCILCSSCPPSPVASGEHVSKRTADAPFPFAQQTSFFIDSLLEL